MLPSRPSHRTTEATLNMPHGDPTLITLLLLHQRLVQPLQNTTDKRQHGLRPRDTPVAPCLVSHPCLSPPRPNPNITLTPPPTARLPTLHNTTIRHGTATVLIVDVGIAALTRPTSWLLVSVLRPWWSNCLDLLFLTGTGIRAISVPQCTTFPFFTPSIPRYIFDSRFHRG